MTDYWTTQDGRIYDALTIQCYAGGTISEGNFVEIADSASTDKLTVTAANGTGDAIGIALKSASSGDTVPVLVYGVYKCKAGAAITGNVLVMNSGATYVVASSSPTVVATGRALQKAAAANDYILVLIGATG